MKNLLPPAPPTQSLIKAVPLQPPFDLFCYRAATPHQISVPVIQSPINEDAPILENPSPPFPSWLFNCWNDEDYLRFSAVWSTALPMWRKIRGRRRPPANPWMDGLVPSILSPENPPEWQPDVVLACAYPTDAHPHGFNHWTFQFRVGLQRIND